MTTLFMGHYNYLQILEIWEPEIKFAVGVWVARKFCLAPVIVVLVTMGGSVFDVARDVSRIIAISLRVKLCAIYAPRLPPATVGNGGKIWGIAAYICVELEDGKSVKA